MHSYVPRKSKVLVTGADGMAGRAVVAHCRRQGDEVMGYNRQTLDITNNNAVASAFRQTSPEIVINCAAWTDVDGCQSDPDRAFDVNARAVERLAVNSRQCGASFVTISTDYVFDGEKDGFYTQRDDPNPISVYGDSKLQGERRAQNAYARTIVARTSWVFGMGGRNFLSTVIDRVQRGERITVITDAYGTPTYGDDLAERLRLLAGLDIPGVYHVVNQGLGATYEEFTLAALAQVGRTELNVERTTMADLNRPALRPRNSRLRCAISEALGLPPLPDWKLALGVFSARMGKQ